MSMRWSMSILGACVLWGAAMGQEPAEKAEVAAAAAAAYAPEDMESAIDYMLSQAVVCEPEIRFHFPQKFKMADAQLLSAVLMDYRIADCQWEWLEAGEGALVKLKPVYKSCVRMVKHLRAPQSIELTPKELEAFNKAGQIIKSLKLEGKSYAKKARAIHDWIVANCRYDEESIKNKVRAPKDPEEYSPFDGKFLILEQKGVCDSYAQGYWLLLQMAGVPSCMVNGVVKRSQSHAWNLVYMGDHWGHVDTTFDDPVPDVPGRVKTDFFDKTNKMMDKTRKWRKPLFSPSNKVLRYEHVEEFVAYLQERRKKRDQEFTVLITSEEESEKFNELAAQAAEKLGLTGSISAAVDLFYPGAMHVKYRRRAGK